MSLSAPEVGDLEVAIAGGRALTLIRNEMGDEIQVQSPEGEVEVCIVVTDRGPVVRLRATRLELDAAEDVSFSCERFTVHTRAGTTLTTDGQLRLRAEEQVLIRAKEELDLKGRPVRTNLKDGLFYDDYIKPINGPRWGTAFAGLQRFDAPPP